MDASFDVPQEEWREFWDQYGRITEEWRRTDPLLDDKPLNHGTYEVWYRGETHVADVESVGVREVVELTSRPIDQWRNDPSVTILIERPLSTCIDDVIVDPTCGAWEVQEEGYMAVEPPLPAQERMEREGLVPQHIQMLRRWLDDRTSVLESPARPDQDHGEARIEIVPPTPLGSEIDAIVAGLEAGWQAESAKREEAREIHRDVDSSGLTASERELYYHEQAGGSPLTYRYWVPDGPDLAEGSSPVVEFRAIDADNAADRLFDTQSPEIGGVLMDEHGRARRFDGESFKPVSEREPREVTDYDRLLALASARGPVSDQDRGPER